MTAKRVSAGFNRFQWVLKEDQREKAFLMQLP